MLNITIARTGANSPKHAQDCCISHEGFLVLGPHKVDSAVPLEHTQPGVERNNLADRLLVEQAAGERHSRASRCAMEN